MIYKKLLKLFLVLVLFLCPTAVFAQENIDPDNDGSQYAWGENVGWLNLEPGGDAGQGVEVLVNKLAGYMWGENIGWISLSCENTNNCSMVNYGVINDGVGFLSGYAYGENVGWINFAPTVGGVFIDACGDFNGEAWGENIGWISFRSDGVNSFRIRTSWASPVDEIPPVTEPDSPFQEWYNSDIEIYLSASDCGHGATEVRYTLDGGPPVVTPGSTATVSITTEGEHTLVYYSVDPDNIETENVVTFSLDKTVPTITIATPSDATTYFINAAALADYIVTDAGSGVATVVATLPEGDPIDTSSTGSHSFTVSATDIAGNSHSVTHTYTVTYPGNIDPDNDGSHFAWGENVGWINFKPSFGPGVTVTDTDLTGYAWGENIGWIILNPVNGGVINDGYGNLSGYAWGENVGWINFAPTGGGVTINACGEFNGYAWGENVGWISFRSDGTNPFYVRTSWTSPIDTVAPVTAPDEPVQSWYTGEVSINLVATDCGSGAQEINYSLNGGSEISTPGASASVSITEEGCHTLDYYSVDADGNTELTNSAIICVDKTPPAITITTPPDGVTYYQGTPITADYTVTDTGSGISVLTTTETDGDPIDTSSIGNHTFAVSATDAAGNNNSITNNYTVIVDTTSPVITITAPAEGAAYLVNESVTVDFSAVDNESGIAGVTSTLPNGNAIDTSTAGSYSFTVDATDNAGNNNSLTSNYTVFYPPENIDPDADGSQYAWGENVGWINFAPSTGPGVAVTDTAVYGMAWGENIGWINLSPPDGGVFNDGEGNLSGYAWGENVGWINFAPTGRGVEINACGEFNGYAWGENIGWINFRSDGPNPFYVRTSWTSPVDTVAPVTAPDEPVQSWYTGEVSINLVATDCGSGAQEIHYSLNGGGEVSTPGASASVSITEEGCHTLDYYSVDADGNTELTNSEIICVDKTPPAITITTPPDGVTYNLNESVLADYTVTDTGSGISVLTATQTDGDPIDTSSKGNHTFTVSATDVAGNSTTQTFTYTVDYPGNMDPDNDGSHYAWCENVGWINLRPTWGPGITVGDTAVTGMAWGENIGWVNFNPTSGGVVNDGLGNLSGFAWAENAGWINFTPTGGGVSIDSEGVFSGYAWGENIGWCNFAPTNGGVKSSWISPNSPPDAVNDYATTDEDMMVTIDVASNDSDVDGNLDPISASVQSGPSNGTLVNNGDGTFTYTPNANFNGEDGFSYDICDTASACDTALVTINVKAVNDEPVVTAGADMTIDEAGIFTSSGSFTDPDANNWTATVDYGDGSGGQPLPLTGNSFNLSHLYTDDGVYTVTVTVTDDDGGAGSDTLTVTVNNFVPTVDAGADQTVNEGATVSLNAPFTDPGITDTHTASIDWGDGTIEPGDVGANSVTGSHVYSDDGSYTVNVTVTDDDGGAGSDTLTVTVNNFVPTVDAGADQTVNEGATVSLNAPFTDPGITDTHTASIDWGDGTIEPGDVGANSVTGSHVYSDDGSYTVTVTVTDDDGGAGSDTLTVTVNNFVPTVDAGADQTVNEGATVSLNAPFTDPGITDTHTASIDWGDGTIEPGDVGANSVTGSHVYSDDGSYTVNVTVTDDDGGEGSDTLEVGVLNVAPTVDAGADATINEGMLASLDSSTFSDSGVLDYHTATIDWGDGTGTEPGAVSELSGEGTISGTHVYADNGIYTVEVCVIDDDDATTCDTLTITAENVAPTVETGVEQTIDEGAVVTLNLSTFNDLGTFDTHMATIDWGDNSPIDTGVVTESPFGPPGNTSGVDGTVSGTHSYAEQGVYAVAVCVEDDDGGVGCADLTVNVQNVSPSVDTGPDATINEGSILSSSGLFTDPGIEDTWSATVDYGDGSGVQPLPLTGNSFNLSHLYTDDGIRTVTVTVTDDDDGVGSDTLVVTVVNVAPTADDQAITTPEDTQVEIVLTAADPGDDTLTYSVVTGPSHGTLNGTAPSLTYTPAADYYGTDSFTFIASDEVVDSNIATVTITIDPINDQPVIQVDVSTQTVQYSDGIGPVTIILRDIDSASIDLSSEWSDRTVFNTGLPSNLSMDAYSCSAEPAPGPEGANALSCTVTLSGQIRVPEGDYTITLTVNDGSPESSTASAETVVVVQPEDTETFFGVDNPVAVRVVTPGGNGQFQLVVRTRELQPDIADNDPFAGDISLSQVSVTLVPVGPGSNVAGICVQNTSGTGYDAVLTATCNFSGVPVNTYKAEFTVAGGYYTGYSEDVVTVYDPSLGFATGGGWFYWPGTDEKTNFGFTMKYNKKGKKGTNVKGNLLLIRHRPDGTIYRVKSNALYGLSLGDEGDFGWATFSGKATYKHYDWDDPVGNHEFVVYVEDRDEPGNGIDRFWIQVKDKDRDLVDEMSMPTPATKNTTELQGGNIVAPHS